MPSRRQASSRCLHGVDVDRGHVVDDGEQTMTLIAFSGMLSMVIALTMIDAAALPLSLGKSTCQSGMDHGGSARAGSRSYSGDSRS